MGFLYTFLESADFLEDSYTVDFQGSNRFNLQVVQATRVNVTLHTDDRSLFYASSLLPTNAN